MNDLKIRRIKDVLDFDEVMEIEVITFEEPYTKEMYLHDFLKHPYSEYYKLVKDDHMIGFVGLWVLYDQSQITTFAIHPDYQRKGYGKMLMDFVINHLKTKGCENITLEVRISNEKAIHLYEKYHFYKVSKRKHYYENGEDAYLMKCDLIS